MLTVLLGLAGALTYGAADFFGGLASRRSSTLLTTAGVAVVGLAGLLVASAVVPATSSLDAWLLGGASGLAGALAIGLLYGSLAIGPMSILSPTTAFISAIVPVSIGLGLGEGSGASFFVALGVALLAVIFVGFVPEKGAIRPRAIGLFMAVASGALIGLTIVLIDATPDDSGLLPLVANRTVSTVALTLTVALVLGYRRAKGAQPRLPGLAEIPGVWAMIVVAGILDVLANVVVLYGLRVGALSVMAVLVALYPAGTIVLAGIWLKERVAPIQWVGLALALIASALLAL